MRKPKRKITKPCNACNGTGKVTTDVTCNRCGESCVPARADVPYGLRGDVTGGYHSSALEDMQRYRFRLCEPCCKWLFAQCKVPVDLTECDFG
jgi:hypothetical protein